MTHSADIEDRRSSGSRTPLLGSSSHQRIGGGSYSDDKKWSAGRVFRFLGGGIYAPDTTTYDPLEILLNTEDEDEKDDLTVKWRDNKLSELSFVGVVVRTGIEFTTMSHCLIVLLHVLQIRHSLKFIRE
jgi:hypothetical protein